MVIALSKSKVQKEQIIDPATGEVKSEKLVIDINKKNKISYGDNNWYATNQKGVRDLTQNEIGKSLYTVKGRVFHYLLSILKYGNFAPFNATHISKQLEITRQAVYKAKKDLLKDDLIREAIDTTTGQKGVIVTNILVQKGSENEDIAVIQKKEKTTKSNVS